MLRYAAPSSNRCAARRRWVSDVRFGSQADMCSAKRHVRFTPNSGHSAFIISSARTSNVAGTSRPHLAVRLSKSHMTMGGGSDKSIDGRGDTSDHRRQQRDWP
jgi:hypothetical protein